MDMGDCSVLDAKHEVQHEQTTCGFGPEQSAVITALFSFKASHI